MKAPLAFCVLITLNASHTVPRGAPYAHQDVPQEVLELGIAQLLAWNRINVAALGPQYDLAFRPIFQKTDVGDERIVVFRARNGAMTHSRSILVGFDGSHAYLLGGTESPSVVALAQTLNLRLGVDSAVDGRFARLFARLGDPNSAFHVTEVGKVLRTPPEKVQVGREGSVRTSGPSVCIVVESSATERGPAFQRVTHCFQANELGRVISWAQRVQLVSEDP